MSALTINQETHGDIQLLTLQGSLDTTTVSDFEKHCEALLNGGHVKAIVDIGQVEYISSAGVGMLLGFRNDFEDRDGKFVLCNTPPQVERVLNILDLYSLFEHTTSIEDAKSRF